MSVIWMIILDDNTGCKGGGEERSAGCSNQRKKEAVRKAEKMNATTNI